MLVLGDIAVIPESVGSIQIGSKSPRSPVRCGGNTMDVGDGTTEVLSPCDIKLELCTDDVFDGYRLPGMFRAREESENKLVKIAGSKTAWVKVLIAAILTKIAKNKVDQMSLEICAVRIDKPSLKDRAYRGLSG